MSVRGVIVGSAGLITLYNLTSANPAGLKTLGYLPGVAAKYLVDPTVPLIPDRRPTAPTTAPDGSTTQQTPQGDRLYTDPLGKKYLGGPGGIPIYPN